MARRPRPFGELPDRVLDYRDERPGMPPRITTENASIAVTDDWPDAVPVTDHEARIIEAFFADVLDELFGPLPR
jgi:hypothetical protein